MPSVSSVLERRLLVNYRLDPEAAARVLPAGLRPEVVSGYAVGGICLVRLSGVRPTWVPAAVPQRIGLRSENAAHRFAVTWTGPDGGERRGVYVSRRDTGSRLVSAFGGRIFPAEQNLARFAVRESGREVAVAFASQDRSTMIDVRVVPRAAGEWPGGVLFADLEQASRFFREAPVAVSARSASGAVDGLELRAAKWRIEPAEIRSARSSFFDDPVRFPRGSARLDCALLMWDVPAVWAAREPECAGI